LKSGADEHRTREEDGDLSERITSAVKSKVEFEKSRRKKRKKKELYIVDVIGC
jgi:hypothetical protein